MATAATEAVKRRLHTSALAARLAPDADDAHKYKGGDAAGTDDEG